MRNLLFLATLVSCASEENLETTVITPPEETIEQEEIVLQEIPELEGMESPDLNSVFDEESAGNWTSTETIIDKCQVPSNFPLKPLKKIWHNFSPFFKYKWDQDFKAFAALALAIWEKESQFMIPEKVVINPNCKNKNPITVSTLSGKNKKNDLKSSRQKDSFLKKKLGKCNANLSDFGVFQWNFHWRLSHKHYSNYVKKALLLSSKYRKKNIEKFTQKELSSLVKYNSKALFILGGIYFADNFEKPRRTISAYNSNETYRTNVNNRRNEFWEALQEVDRCILDSKLKKN